ncbi:MAG: transcriptional regulator [Tissierellia bacterium]|nr:transcriptional regulator [Tissierellia bacterium]
MRLELREHYVKLVNFLGLVIGPSYEIALHDLSMGDDSIIAIANGHVTNRTIGSPLTPLIMEYISDERYKTEDYDVNYYSVSMKNKILRSSTIYIKDRGKLVGLLCVTFDDSKFKDVSNAVMSLCHPDELIKGFSFERIDDLSLNQDTEIVSTNIEELVHETINSIVKRSNLSIDRLKKKDRLYIVTELKKRGIFSLKNAITEVAKKLDVSEATAYRYLNELEKNNL